MTPEQMRELADILEPMAAAPVFEQLDIPGAVALLHQCAEQRPCTCHPDDNPPVPCAQKYALSECRAASEPTEAQRLEGAIYGIIDPDYGRVYTITRKLAWEEGYAIGLHGSFTRDLDMIAVPWADTTCDPEHLIRRIVDATGLKLRREPSSKKPHGRLAWSLHFPAFGDPRFVDLSVMPSVNKPTEARIAWPVRADEGMLRAMLSWRECDERDGLSGEASMFDRVYHALYSHMRDRAALAAKDK